MYTKSKIQMINEMIQARNEFKSVLEEIMDKYNVEDSIFTYTNNRVVEVVDGYFVPQNEYSTVEEAINNCGVNMGIRIQNNKNFVVGNIYEMLSMCQNSSNVLNINKLEEIG